jgi:hypothetical protein
VEKTIQWWSGYVICSAVTYAFAALSATRLTLSDMQRHRQLSGCGSFCRVTGGGDS